MKVSIFFIVVFQWVILVDYEDTKNIGYIYVFNHWLLFALWDRLRNSVLQNTIGTICFYNVAYHKSLKI